MVRSKREKNFDDIADQIQQLAVSDNVYQATKLIRKHRNKHLSPRMLEVQSSVCDMAYGISKNNKYQILNLEAIIARIVLDINNTRLYLDIGDYFSETNNIVLAQKAYEMAKNRLSTLEDVDWREELYRRLKDIG